MKDWRRALAAFLVVLALASAGLYVFTDWFVPSAAPPPPPKEAARPPWLGPPAALSVALPSAPVAVSDGAAPANPTEERRLLDEARAAVVRGDPGGAVRMLDDLKARYPDGAFADEREALAVRALIDMGRLTRARARRARFHERFPTSPFTQSVDDAIESISGMTDDEMN